MFVLTADQRGSRTDRDRVADVLRDYATVPAVRGIDRTAGDEFQAVFDDAATVAGLAVDLAVEGHWSVGIGVGEVERPLPDQTRAGRGPAFEFARTAVESARGHRHRLWIAGDSRWCVHAQTAAWQLVDLLSGRSAAGREAVALIDEGLTQSEVAGRIGITAQAVSLRLQAARWDLEDPSRRLLVDLLRLSADPPPA